jgi:polyhydroxyalkanoate synthase subunit PhaE
MSDNHDNNNPFETIIADWMKGSTDFWKTWEKSLNHAFQGDSSPTGAKKEGKTGPQEAFETYLNSFKIISEVFSAPEGIARLVKGTEVLPTLFLKIFKSALDSCTAIQTKLWEKGTRIGAKTKAYHFDNLDQEIFHVWTEIYEKEFKQFFQVPALGLNRFYVERINQTSDALNIFHAKLSEFMFVLYLPMEKSFKVLQEQLAQKAEQGDLPENSGDYYRMWIKILEGHYMTLFQSEDYATVLNQTIEAMSDFKTRRDEVLRDILQNLAIPTQLELDELYKELYETKKRLRALEKTIKDIKN